MSDKRKGFSILKWIQGNTKAMPWPIEHRTIFRKFQVFSFSLDGFNDAHKEARKETCQVMSDLSAHKHLRPMKAPIVMYAKRSADGMRFEVTNWGTMFATLVPLYWIGGQSKAVCDKPETVSYSSLESGYKVWAESKVVA